MTYQDEESQDAPLTNPSEVGYWLIYAACTLIFLIFTVMTIIYFNPNLPR
jgi:hypothetical protein